MVFRATGRSGATAEFSGGRAVSDAQSSNEQVFGSFVLSGVLAAAAAMWHSPWWWAAVAVCAVGAVATVRPKRRQSEQVTAFYAAALVLGRAELTCSTSRLPQLVQCAFHDPAATSGVASIDKPGILELTRIRCAKCGAEYSDGLKYDLHLRPATAAQYAQCGECGASEVVLTYNRADRGV